MRHEIITDPSEEMDQLILLLPLFQIEKLACYRVTHYLRVAFEQCLIFRGGTLCIMDRIDNGVANVLSRNQPEWGNRIPGMHQMLSAC